MGFLVESSLAGSVAPIRGLVSFGTLTQGSLRFALGFTPSSASRAADWNTRPPHSKAAETVMDPTGSGGQPRAPSEADILFYRTPSTMF